MKAICTVKHLFGATALLLSALAAFAQDTTAPTAASAAIAASAPKAFAGLRKAHEASCKTSAGKKAGEELRTYMRSCVTERADKAKACRTEAGDKRGPALATAMSECMGK